MEKMSRMCRAYSSSIFSDHFFGIKFQQQIIELKFGCHHITCRCGHHFCYRCGGKRDRIYYFDCDWLSHVAPWDHAKGRCPREPNCELWDEQMLLEERERDRQNNAQIRVPTPDLQPLIPEEVVRPPIQPPPPYRPVATEWFTLQSFRWLSGGTWSSLIDIWWGR